MSTATTYDPGTTFDSLAPQIQNGVEAAGPIVIGVAAPVIVFGLIWRLVKRAAKG